MFQLINLIRRFRNRISYITFSPFESFAFRLTNGNVFLNYFLIDLFYFIIIFFFFLPNGRNMQIRRKVLVDFQCLTSTFRVHFVIGVFDSLSSPCKMKKLEAWKERTEIFAEWKFSHSRFPPTGQPVMIFKYVSLPFPYYPISFTRGNEVW